MMSLNQLSYLFLAIKDFVAPLKGYFDSLESMDIYFIAMAGILLSMMNYSAR